jgi:hypothetical protein
VPWPDFTELTFGYAYLRELERRHATGGAFPLAPDFISQNDEAELGYDVAVTLDGATPLFIQFKRSFVLTRSNAREVLDGTYSGPQIFRMHLHKRGAYRQHKALQRLEAAGNEVQYVTSQIYTRRQFDDAFAQQRIVSHASAHFLPSEITLPDDTDEHHVSFRAEDPHGYVYSEEGRQFPRKVANRDTWSSRVRERRRSYKENLRSLKKAVQVMSSDVSNLSPLGRLLRNKPVEQKASILAYVTLDAQLTFVKEV